MNNKTVLGPHIISEAVHEKHYHDGVRSMNVMDHGYETRRGQEDDNDKFNRSNLILCSQESDKSSKKTDNTPQRPLRIDRKQIAEDVSNQSLAKLAGNDSGSPLPHAGQMLNGMAINSKTAQKMRSSLAIVQMNSSFASAKAMSRKSRSSQRSKRE